MLHIQGCILLAFLSPSAAALPCPGPQATPASDRPAEVDWSPVGHWAGAFIRGNSAQTVEVDLTRDGDRLLADVEVPDWLWWPAPDGEAVLEGGVLRLALVYGEARLTVDRERDEMVGTLGEGARTLHVHLKRAARRPRIAVVVEAFSVVSGDVTLEGTLTLPPWPGPHPALVTVAGRGPSERWEGDLARARMFAERGIACCVYDKRGSGASGGDLDTARAGDLDRDLRAVLDHVARDERIDAAQVGLGATSAGGWVALRVAAEDAGRVAFLSTYCAPATSVLEQQRDAVDAWMVERGFGREERDLARTYVDLLAAADDWPAVERVRALALAGGWGALLEGDPASADELRTSWVVRHDYDPAVDLARLRVPVLAQFGERDWIVPPGPSVAALRSAKLTDCTTVVLPGVQHTADEWPAGVRTPNDDPYASYFHFNKLMATLWVREFDWISARVRFPSSDPLQR